MTETIVTNNYERRVRISTRTNDAGAIEELHARITGKSVTLTRVSTRAKPKSFWISEEELDKLMVTRYTYKDWLKRRASTLAEAKALCRSDKSLQPGDLNYREEYHENAADETYEVYTVGGYGTDNCYHNEESIWLHVTLEDLVEQINDAQQRVKEQAVQGETETLTPQERAEVRWETKAPVQLTQEGDIAYCEYCKKIGTRLCPGCQGWFCVLHYEEHVEANIDFTEPAMGE